MFTNLSIVMSGFSGCKELLIDKNTVYAEVDATDNTPEPQWKFTDIQNLDPAISDASKISANKF